jgi:hypothetical protein
VDEFAGWRLWDLRFVLERYVARADSDYIEENGTFRCIDGSPEPNRYRFSYTIHDVMYVAVPLISGEKNLS